MSNIKISSNVAGTGTLQIAAPNTNTDRTLTLPDESGTVLTSASPVITQAGVPAFSAYTSGGQTINGATSTKITVNTEHFDTASNYDISTYRFTPTTAGYYLINIYVGIASNLTSYYCDVRIYKNGGAILGQPITGGGGNGTSYFRGSASTIVYANGVTDYFELYAASNLTLTTAECGFSGVLVRAA